MMFAPIPAMMASTPAAQRHHANICIIGRLARKPVVRISADGSPHLTVEVHQPDNRLPIVACKHGTADDRHDIEELAMRLGTDDLILVLGDGLAAEPDQADDAEIPIEVQTWRLRLVECRAIREVRMVDPVEAKPT